MKDSLFIRCIVLAGYYTIICSADTRIASHDRYVGIAAEGADCAVMDRRAAVGAASLEKLAAHGAEPSADGILLRTVRP